MKCLRKRKHTTPVKYDTYLAYSLVRLFESVSLNDKNLSKWINGFIRERHLASRVICALLGIWVGIFIETLKHPRQYRRKRIIIPRLELKSGETKKICLIKGPVKQILIKLLVWRGSHVRDDFQRRKFRERKKRWDRNDRLISEMG